MRLKITTPLRASMEDVKEGFTEDLFVKLSPPFPKVRLKQFDGCKKGDIVSLELDFITFRQLWTSKIIDDELTGGHWLFVDQGTELPFFLSSWRHNHWVKNTSTGSEVVDDIEFSTGWLLTDWLFLPAMYLQFLYRKPVYRRVFDKK